MNRIRLWCATAFLWLLSCSIGWCGEPGGGGSGQCCPQQQPVPTQMQPVKPGEQPQAPPLPQAQQPAMAQPPSTDAFSQAPSAGTAGGESFSPQMIGDHGTSGSTTIRITVPITGTGFNIGPFPLTPG